MNYYASSASFFHLLLTVSLLHEITPRLEFTNFVCTTKNKDFGDFEDCILKSVNRTYKYASLKEDATLEKLSIEMVDHRITYLLPLPDGDYMVQSEWTINKKLTVVIKLYASHF